MTNTQDPLLQSILKEFDEKFYHRYKNGGEWMWCCRGDFCEGHDEEATNLKSFIKSTIEKELQKTKEEMIICAAAISDDKVALRITKFINNYFNNK